MSTTISRTTHPRLIARSPIREDKITPRPDGNVIELPKPQTLIGRSGTCDLQILNRVVSKEHCRLHLGGGSSGRVYDLDSTNGTKVNGYEVNGDASISDGDEITIGRLRFTLDKNTGKTHHELDNEVASALRAGDSKTTSPQTMSVTLSGRTSKKDFNVSPGEKIIIGSSRNCGLRVRSGEISSKHASLINTDDGRWAIKDYGGTLGTFINGIPINSNVYYKLNSGDEVTLGITGNYTLNIQ